MNTKILEYIIAIAEEKSITQAAERFYLSQPVLSRHLKKIEEELGVPLFVRNSRQMSLTKAGILFVNNAQAILHLEQQLQKQLEDMRREQKNSLTILIDVPYLNYFHKTILPLFRQKYPDFSIQFSDTSAAAAPRLLTSRQADLALFPTTSPPDDRLDYLPLHSDELLAVFPPGYQVPALGKEGILAAYESDPIFGLHPPGSTFRYMEDEILAAAHITPVTTYQVVSFQDSLRCLDTWQCCVFLPSSRLNGVDPGLYQTISLSPPYQFQLIAAYPKNISFQTPVRVLLQIMLEQFERFGHYTASSPSSPSM